ncbi:major facilitator superfamily domain-containing protein 3-like [Uloborus diversus]|uniref:major facilitator superfamily domain-containing protein 3-like n=1 Tax=Uloborus diversus TaxID=327109 RepID=UPI0024093F12|nr:major facilitator superfamily domain-containing protein 3-like [Uloborus diversus]
MIGKIFTLGVAYFVQGIAYGFQDKFIPMYLRSAGFSHTRLSLMKLVHLPWLCKTVFAPFIDLFWSKWMWLIFSLASLTFVSFLGIFINIEYFFIVSTWLLLLNFLSAFQDVSVDALALHILQEQEMGHGNTAQVVGYKLGALFGGGIVFWVHYYHGWSFTCLCLTSMYIMSMVVFLPMYTQYMKSTVESDKGKQKLKKEDTPEKSPKLSEVERPFSIEESHQNLLHRRHVQKNDDASSEERTESSKPLVSSKKYNIYEIPHLVLSTKGTLPVVFFLLLYKLGERGALSTFPIFLVDQGFSTKDIGLWTGIFGQLASLVGSFGAGMLISQKLDLSMFLHYVLIARSIPIFFQWIIINLWFPSLPSFLHSVLFFFGAISMCVLEFSAGMVTTSVFTLMMTCSLKAPAALQATHYSVLSTAEVGGKLIFSSLSGALIDWLGLSQMYFTFFVLSKAEKGPKRCINPVTGCLVVMCRIVKNVDPWIRIISIEIHGYG